MSTFVCVRSRRDCPGLRPTPEVNTTISDVSHEHHISIDDDVHDDSLLSNLGNDDFDNGDDSLSLYESADHANDEYGILQPNDNGNIFSEQNEL